MEETFFDVFEPSEYVNELYNDAKANAKRRDRLQRRLDGLSKEQWFDWKHSMRQRIFKAGIEYYEARAEYCYCLADNAYELEYKIWNDCLLDMMAELDACLQETQRENQMENLLNESNVSKEMD